jgi:predicted XRE-type DNA-binding protein
MIRMEQHLKAQGWTQAEAAKRLGITQPRVSRLIKGQWQDFSLDMLPRWLLEQDSNRNCVWLPSSDRSNLH